jgi:hypothetical protein
MVDQLVKNYAYFSLCMFNIIFVRARHWTLHCFRLNQSKYTNLRHILILSSDLRLGLPSGPSAFTTKNTVWVSQLPMRATCFTHFSLDDLVTLIEIVPASNRPIARETWGVSGRVTAQEASRRPLATDTRVRPLVSPCRICVVQSVTGTGYSPSSSVFPSHYHSTVALHTHTSSGR